jgi:hypothetical protein
MPRGHHADDGALAALIVRLPKRVQAASPPDDRRRRLHSSRRA